MLNIKEIALKVTMDTGLYLDGANQSEPFYVVKPEEIVEFAEALIAEIAKQNEHIGAIQNGKFQWNTDGGPEKWRARKDFSGELYTSDQVAAAILKATKPLEERRCEICGYAEHHREHTGCLRTQLTTAREEIDQLRQRVQEIEKQRDDLIAKNQNLFNALMVSTQKKDNMYASIKAASGHLNLYGLFSCVGGDSYDPECADENVRKANSILRSELATESIKPAGKEDQVVYDLYCEELLQITGNEKFRLKLVDDLRKNRVILCNRCGRDAE